MREKITIKKRHTTFVPHENRFVWRHTNSPHIELTNALTTSGFHPGGNCLCQGQGEQLSRLPIAVPLAPSPAEPAGVPDGTVTVLTRNSACLLPAVQEQENGPTKGCWDYTRYVKFTPVVLHHRCIEGFGPNHLENLLIKNCVVGQCTNMVNDCSTVHVVHLLITETSKNAFICQRAYSAHLSNG